MTVWDSIKKILRSEGADLKDGLDGARDKLDGFLTEKERERAATPKERMDMITDDISETEDEFDRIIEKAEGRSHEQTAESELRDALGGKPKPSPTAESSAAKTTTAPGAQSTPDATQDPAPVADAPATTPTTADPAAAERAAAEKAAADKAAAEKAAAEKAAAERAAEVEAKRRAARVAADAKFEEQKAKAGDLLDELRGELGIDGGADGGSGGTG